MIQDSKMLTADNKFGLMHGITVVGVGEDHCLSLNSKAIAAVAKAHVLVGEARHLNYFPNYDGLKVPFEGSREAMIARIEAWSRENNVAVLASGDPLLFGLGTELIRALGRERVRILSHPGAVQLAFARIGESSAGAKILDLRRETTRGFIGKIQKHRKVAVLTGKDTTPQKLAAYMRRFGEKQWRAFVCEQMGALEESVTELSVSELAEWGAFREGGLLILLRPDPEWSPSSGPALSLEDPSAENHCLSLALLCLREKAVFWDIGSERARMAAQAAPLCPEGEIFAVQGSPKQKTAAESVCKKAKADQVNLVIGKAPDVLEDLPAPDAVYIGQMSGNRRYTIDYVLEVLRPGGVLVAAAATFEQMQEIYAYFKAKALCPEILQLNVSRGVPEGLEHRFEAKNPAHLFVFRKDMESHS